MQDPLIGLQLANYKLERVLGRGGMAQVYYATDVQLNRPAAVKVIDSRYRMNDLYSKRFIQEARGIAAWRHENIVHIYYADEQDGIYFFAMEYIDGGDLAQLLSSYINQGKSMPYPEVVKIGNAVASALDYAHSKGVIHRDIKPSNIMLDKDGRVVLMDFGLALDMAQGSLGETFGTPHYISPEQARKSSDAVPESDLYSFGVILYEILTGAVPFDDPSATAVALQHVTQTPPSPRSINPALNTATERVLLKALNKVPQERYRSAKELMTALTDALFAKESLPDTQKFVLPPLPAGVNPMDTKPLPKPTAPALTTQTIIVQAPGENRRAILFSILGAFLVLGILAGGAFALGVFDEEQQGGNENQARATTLRATNEVAQTIFNATASSLTLTTEAGIEGTNIALTELVTTLDTGMAETGEAIQATSLAQTETANQKPTSAPTTAVAVQPTNTDVPPTNTDVPPTNTDIPPTNTDIPPTNTSEPQGEPTVLYPNGRLIVLIYNQNSFYVWNQTGNRILDTNFAFEALDANGQPVFDTGTTTPIRVDGGRWASVTPYDYLDNGSCLVAEISRAGSYLNPSDCGGVNAIITPSETDSQGFWRTRQEEATVEFRVFFNNEEFARCPLAVDASENRCEVRIP